VTTVRVATRADVEPVVAALTTAFFDDPLWGPAFPDVERRAEQASAFWRLLVTSALRYPWTLVTDKVEAAAVWFPPGGIELTDEEHEGVEPFLVDLTGRAVADGILALFDHFEAARPTEPHYYLSLLATHTDHRGSGLGMSLLRENLARVDEAGLPAYLESCNPANDKRYAEGGFGPREELMPGVGAVVATMWRPAQH